MLLYVFSFNCFQVVKAAENTMWNAKCSKKSKKTHMSHIKTSSRLSITNTKKKCSCKSYLHLFSAWCLLLGVLDTSVCSGRDWVFHATSLRGCLGRMINFAMCVCFHFLSLIFQMFFFGWVLLHYVLLHFLAKSRNENLGQRGDT